MTQISGIHAREVLDSRGRPTVEVDVLVARTPGRSGDRSVWCEHWSGRGFGAARRRPATTVSACWRAVANVNDVIAPRDCADPTDQFALDEKLLALDPSPHKSQLGANAILGVSLAAAHAGAAVRHVPLYRHVHSCFQAVAGDTSAIPQPCMPSPMTNMISGGLHAGHNLDFQDVLVIPCRA